MTRSRQLHLLRTLDKCDFVKTKLVTLSVINARSITPKIHQFQQELLEHHMDICGITETWLKQDDIEATTREIASSGYKILSLLRSTDQQGGGIALVYHDHYNVKQLGKLTNIDTNTMEYQGYHLGFDNIGINLYIIYRLPSSSVIQFCNELSLILESDLDLATDKTLFVGDFNIHTDNHQDTDTINFLDTINGFNLQNLVTFPTHVKQHHLDLILDGPNNPLVHNIEPGMFLSDHCFIHSQLTIVKKPLKTELVTYRKIKAIDLEAFKQDLELALSNQHQGNIDEAVNFYNNKVKYVLDTHAPEKTKVVKRSHNQPWFNDSIKQEIILRRCEERIFRSNPCPYTLNAFYQQRRFVNNIIKTAKRNFYINQLAEHRSDTKKIFEIANKMLYRNEPLPLPPTDNTLKLVNHFNSFFIQKIDKIMSGLIPTESHPVDPKYIESTEKCSIKLDQFHEIDLDETKRLIRTSATKSCEIDPMPTSLLKGCIDIVAPTIMKIINLLLTTQIMPNPNERSTNTVHY